MSPSRGLVALAAVAALSLSACTNKNADAGDVVDAMTDVGLPQDEAECMGNAFEDEFSQDQLNDLAAADDPDEYPSGTATNGDPIDETVTSIINECAGGAQSESGGESNSGSETTTTTEAQGN
jgi:hypothetical protein